MTPRNLAQTDFVMLIVALTLAVSVATPAGAHGAGSAGTVEPNYVTDVTDPGHPGLDWDVDIAHAEIRLTNRTGQTVIVYGYRSEPYLRFDPDGTGQLR